MPFLFIIIVALIVLLVLMFFGHLSIRKQLEYDLKVCNDEKRHLENLVDDLEDHNHHLDTEVVRLKNQIHTTNRS